MVALSGLQSNHHQSGDPAGELKLNGKSATEIGPMSLHQGRLESIQLRLASYNFLSGLGCGTSSL